MISERSTHSVRRRNTGIRKYTGKMILFVEGEKTEVSYFNLLKQTNCKVEPVTQKGHGISKCVDFVNEAIKRYMRLSTKKKLQYKKKWLVFDFDGRSDYMEAIKIAKENGFEVAFSSMCIEYWFLLHFEHHDGSPILKYGNSHSKAIIKKINSHIKEYNKKAKWRVKEYDCNSKEIHEDFFDLLMAVNPVTNNKRIIDAYKRAIDIHNNKFKNGSIYSESYTSIQELLLDLGCIIKSGNSIDIYSM